jgi:pimeloyl-ACP methyl ester carboxylesterase
MKTLDTPNKKIVYDNVSGKANNNNLSATPIPQKIKIEMTVEQAEELLNKPESNRTIILPSGQKVCITESGDPNGTPAIMMSGLSMHSRKYALLLNNYGLKYHVKIIGFDRPNIDGSDPIYFKKKMVKKHSKHFKNIFKKKSSKSSEASSHYSDATLTTSSNDHVHEIISTETHEKVNENASEKTVEHNIENDHDNKTVEENINHPPKENEEVEEKSVVSHVDENHKDRNSLKTKKEEAEEAEAEEEASFVVKKGEVDLKVYAEWVEAIIDTLGIERCHLISLCIGGLYVLGCAKYFKHPEKIASPLYLIAPWAKAQKCVLSIRFVDKFIPTPIIRAAMHCYFRTIGLMVPNAKKNPNAIMFRLIHVDEKADPLGGRRLLFSKVLKSGYFRNETKQICHDDWELGFCVNPNNKLDFSTIDKDVMIYHGTRDKLIPAKSSRYLVKKWNPKYNAELHLKKGKDHSTIKGSCLHDIFKSLSEHSLINPDTHPINPTTTTNTTTSTNNTTTSNTTTNTTITSITN